MKEEVKRFIQEKILGSDFMKATFSGGQVSAWKKVRIRPVLIKDVKHLQFSYWDGQKDISKNYELTLSASTPGVEARGKLNEVINLYFQNIYLETDEEEIQITGGKIKTKRKSTATPSTFTHDKPKNTILDPQKVYEFLKIIGIQTQDGKIKADMQSKFTQINEFLKIVDQTIDQKNLKSPVNIVDLGCGSGYLTFALCYYFRFILKLEADIVGVDLKDDVTDKLNTKCNQLGWRGLVFETGRIANFKTTQKPDIVVALHACDTATDDALQKAIGWASKYIFSSPCCHHDLQTQLKSDRTLTFNPILEQGILKERLGDILTDTFRVLVLESKGYKTEVVEFVSPEHTNRNLMIKASKSSSINFEALLEYQRLKTYWQVTPFIEKLLS